MRPHTSTHLVQSSAITIIYPVTAQKTYSIVLLEKKTTRLRKQLSRPEPKSKLDPRLSWQTALQRAMIRPVRMLVLSPIIASLATLSAIAYGYMYLVFTTITEVFESKYGFPPNLVDLAFLGVGVCETIGVVIFGIISDRRLKRALASQMKMKPEYRLQILIPDSFCILVSLFTYGWTAEKHVFWFVAILGTAIAGAGIMAYHASADT